MQTSSPNTTHCTSPARSHRDPAKLPSPFYDQQNRDEGNRSQKAIHCRKPQHPVRNKKYNGTGCALGQGDVKSPQPLCPALSQSVCCRALSSPWSSAGVAAVTPGLQPPPEGNTEDMMATSTDLLLLLLLGQSWAGASADQEAVVCADTACYTAHWGKLSAAEAQLHCSDNGGNLATVKSEEEAQHIQRALTQLLKLLKVPLGARISKFWIGLQREKGKCLDPNLPLKGFSWVSGGEDTLYTNWHKEVKSTCTFKRCVSLLLDPSLEPQAGRFPKWSESPCGGPDFPGSNIEGFVCKFSFKGMCRPLGLGGPGQVNYTTPFHATSSSLEAVPFATMAHVACGDEGESGQHYLICREKEPHVFDWGRAGPLCVSPKYGCNFNNGGCHQECFEGGDGSFRCGCRPGFRLLDDLVTCASRNPCSSNPCRGTATCISGPQGKGYTCRCPPGYQLDSSLRGCVDVDECQDTPCPQECVNAPGSFRCECWVGYKPSGGLGEETCQDVDECAVDSSLCDQNCTNIPGSFLCSCQKGYILTPEDGTQCQDVDECAGPQGRLCQGRCFNTPGSFYCSCQPGWEVAPDNITCIMGPVATGPSTGPPQGKDTGDKEHKPMSFATTFSSTVAPEGTSEVVPTTRRSFVLHNTPIMPSPPEMLAPSGPPDIQRKLSTYDPTVTTGLEESTGGEFMVKQSNGTDGQKLLLFYILGTVVAILLLLALALGLLIYHKRRARREEMKEKKPQSAADSYSWVPDRAEGRAMENQYR
ncbi:Complement component C1q receptor [Galemys pyrenaicus]|uniref:Complement component C1q receptor n=1 Tax=Galemys pyrenaicus TaxID=202257 RepID=A0A8J6DQD0_GALPY|nr:Complement component C1q receptor [Galemys pyrenaicus]